MEICTCRSSLLVNLQWSKCRRTCKITLGTNLVHFISVNIPTITSFFNFFCLLLSLVNHLWRCGLVVITTAQLHSIKPELGFCAGSNSARGVSEIRDGEDLWQWSRLEIRLNAFRWSTIPQKEFIIIINSTLSYRCISDIN